MSLESPACTAAWKVETIQCTIERESCNDPDRRWLAALEFRIMQSGCGAPYLRAYVPGPWDCKIGIGITIPGAIALAKAGQPNSQADPLS